MLPQTTLIWRRDSRPNASSRPGAAHLIALSHVQDGDDEPRKIYVELTQCAPGFQASDARLTNVDLGILGCRIELAPTSAKSTSAVQLRAGDIVMHQGLLSLVVWDDRGRPYWLNLVDFILAPPPVDDVTTIFFTGWRIVTDVEGQTEPVVVFDRSAPIR